jgi:hypothetical protein
MTTGRINQVAKPTSTAVMKISPQATVPFLGWFREFSLSNSGIECNALTLLQFGGNSVSVGLGLTLCTTLNLLRISTFRARLRNRAVAGGTPSSHHNSKQHTDTLRRATGADLFGFSPGSPFSSTREVRVCTELVPS